MPVLRRSSDPVRAVLLAGALVAAWLLFRELATLLVLVVITLVIAIPLDACASRLEPRGVPRPAGAAIALIAGLAVLGGVLALVIPPFVDQLQRFVDAVPGILSDLHQRLHHLTGGGPRDAGVRVRDILQGYLDKPLRLLGPIASIGLGVAGVVGTFILVLMTAYYVASRPEPLVDGLLSLFPERRRPEVCETLAELRSAWIGWLQGVGVDMAVSGVLLYVGCASSGCSTRSSSRRCRRCWSWCRIWARSPAPCRRWPSAWPTRPGRPWWSWACTSWCSRSRAT